MSDDERDSMQTGPFRYAWPNRMPALVRRSVFLIGDATSS